MRFAEHRQLLERLALGFPIKEVRGSRNVLVVALFWIALPDCNKSRRLFERQRSKKHGIHNTKNRRVRPDAEREREHGHGGEAGVFQQLAKGEFEIVHGSWSVVSGPLSVAGQIPKHQAPEKSQASNSKPRCGGSRLEIEIWSFFGIWVLGFGVFIRTSAPPSDLLAPPFAPGASRQTGLRHQATTRPQ